VVSATVLRFRPVTMCTSGYVLPAREPAKIVVQLGQLPSILVLV
jgi:hypothetical protein